MKRGHTRCGVAVGPVSNKSSIKTPADRQSHWLSISLLFCTILTPASRLPAQVAGELDPGFHPVIEGGVQCVAVQADGRILLGGYLHNVNGIPQQGIARLNWSGTLDGTDTFRPAEMGGSLYSIVVQGDGKVLLGGLIYGGDGFSRKNGIARLLEDGTLESTDAFNMGDGVDSPGTGYSGSVFAVALQPDGKVLIAGSFTTFNGEPHGGIVRLHPHGTVDSAFTANLGSGVASSDGYWMSLAVQADGKILLVGNFTSVSHEPRNRIARFRPDGTLETTATFDPGAGANGFVRSVAVQPDGKILIGGDFTAINGQPRNRIARLHANGSLEATTTFNPGTGVTDQFSAVGSLALQADGKILLGGGFSRVNGQPRRGIARLHPDGTLEATSTFNPGGGVGTGPGDVVQAIALQADGRILLGGQFSHVDNQTRHRVARLINDPALSALEVSGPTSVRWMRGGSCPEIGAALLESRAPDQSEWTPLGTGQRIPGGWSWNLSGPLPAAGSIRARGLAAAGAGSGVVESVVSFGQNLVPNLTVRDLEGTRLSSGTGPVSPGATFGANSRTLTFSVENSGTGPLRDLAVSVHGTDASGFSVVMPPESCVAPGRSTSFAVRFAPGVPGERNAELRLAHNAPGGPFVIFLSGVRADVLSPFFPTDTEVPATRDGFTAMGIDFGTLTLGFAPQSGDFLTVVDNTGALPVSGRFNGLPDGGQISANFDGRTFTFLASYSGGTGNDVVLIPLLTTAGAADPAFNPHPRGRVYAMAMQPDGKCIIGGYSDPNGPGPSGFLTRINVDGSADPGLNYVLQYHVDAVAVQDDGKIIAGGMFENSFGNSRRHLFRLLPGGSIDAAFNPSPDNCVCSMAVQADGKILIGGGFGTVGGVSRNGWARLNPDGSVDTQFDPRILGGGVVSIALQKDGKIVIGGSFTSVGGATRNGLARLNPDGSVDSGFVADVSANGIYWIVIQPDGKIVIERDGGIFGGPAYRPMARLNADGSLDPAFTPAIDSRIGSAELQADGRIIIGGEFSVVDGVTRNRLARLQPDGSLDPIFDPNVNNGFMVERLILQGDGKVLVGGMFDSIGGLPRDGLARVHNDPATGSLQSVAPGSIRWLRGGSAPEVSHVAFDVKTPGTSDWSRLGTAQRITGGWEMRCLDLPAAGLIRARGRTTGSGGSGLVEQTMTLTEPLSAAQPGCTDVFNPAVNGEVRVTALQADGRILVGGSFTGTPEIPANHLARFHTTGAVDAGFDPHLDGMVACMALQTDGMIIAGGAFSHAGGAARHYCVRLLPDGLADPDFHPDIDERVLCAAVQQDGKTLIGGTFTAVDGSTRMYLARLDPGGSLDAGFNPAPNSAVLSLALQEDGKILLGGIFTSVGGVARHYIARLHPDGTPDAAFDPDAGFAVHSLAVQADGKIIAGGDFTSMGGATHNRLARIHPDGSLDQGFIPDIAVGTVRTVALQTDGGICAGGNFDIVNGQRRRRFARLAPDGSLDAGLDDPGIIGYPDSSVASVSVQSDGGILIGGTFSSAGGFPRKNLAQLVNDPATSTLQITGSSTVRWLRGGSSPEVSHVTFEQKPPGAGAWIPLGSGQRIAGGWELNGISLPASGSIRALGRAGASLHESIQPIRSALELWRLEHFDTDANTGDAADTADPDSDSIPNLVEHALGLNPKLNSTGSLPSGKVIGSDLVLSVTRPAGLGGITISAEWSSTLRDGGWTAVPDTGTPPEHTFRVPVETNRTVFLRLKVTAP